MKPALPSTLRHSALSLTTTPRWLQNIGQLPLPVHSVAQYATWMQTQLGVSVHLTTSDTQAGKPIHPGQLNQFISGILTTPISYVQSYGVVPTIEFTNNDGHQFSFRQMFFDSRLIVEFSVPKNGQEKQVAYLQCALAELQVALLRHHFLNSPLSKYSTDCRWHGVDLNKIDPTLLLEAHSPFLTTGQIYALGGVFQQHQPVTEWIPLLCNAIYSQFTPAQRSIELAAVKQFDDPGQPMDCFEQLKTCRLCALYYFCSKEERATELRQVKNCSTLPTGPSQRSALNTRKCQHRALAHYFTPQDVARQLLTVDNVKSLPANPEQLECALQVRAVEFATLYACLSQEAFQQKKIEIENAVTLLTETNTPQLKLRYIQLAALYTTEPHHNYDATLQSIKSATPAANVSALQHGTTRTVKLAALYYSTTEQHRAAELRAVNDIATLATDDNVLLRNQLALRHDQLFALYQFLSPAQCADQLTTVCNLSSIPKTPTQRKMWLELRRSHLLAFYHRHSKELLAEEVARLDRTAFSGNATTAYEEQVLRLQQITAIKACLEKK